MHWASLVGENDGIIIILFEYQKLNRVRQPSTKSETIRSHQNSLRDKAWQFITILLFLIIKLEVLIAIIFSVLGMLPIERSKDLIQQINRILRRLQHIKQVKVQLFDFITEVQELSSTFSQKIHKEMIALQQKVVKNSLYSTQKANYIVNSAKIYRQYSIQLEKNSKINIINLHRIKSEDILKQQQKLKRKCQLFLKQFNQYLQSQKAYNRNYKVYNKQCNQLDQVIRKFGSYKNPVAFYNQTLTKQYILQLDNKYNLCTNEQSTVINENQGLDQTRKWMGDHIKEINQYYVILLHIYLLVIESIINCIVMPKKEDDIRQSKIGLRDPQRQSVQNQQNFQLQKFNNLYASQLNSRDIMQDNIVEEYSQLFKKSLTQNELNSDYKFFYDRCDSIRTKKLKTTDQVVKIQSLLIAQLSSQSQNYVNYESSYKAIEKDIFTNNGIDMFKKRFRKYFGSNFLEVLELCLAVLDKQKKSLEKIGKSMEDNKEKMQKLMENKVESIKLFEKRTKIVLDDHLKLKQKTYSKDSVDTDQLKILKDSITSSFNQLKKSLIQVENNESEVDKMFFSNLKNHNQIVLREAVNKNLSKILEKEKNRLNILQSLNVDSEIVLILKEDSRYEMLVNECPKPNLYITFQSLIKKKQYDQTKKLLQMKQNRLKNMIRSKKGCCSITSQPIKNNVLSEHDCKLIVSQKKYGVLNVTSTGLIFEQKTWIPWKDQLRLMIPQTDISSFDIKKLNEKQVVEINTYFGNLVFQSKQSNQIVESMQKNITFKLAKQPSQREKRNDSSLSIKNNTSTEFKLSYDKSFVNSNQDTTSKINNKNQPKTRTLDAIIHDFIKKWKEAELFNSHFTKVIKNLPQKSESRRDYSYKSDYSKFYLKQRRQYQLQAKNIVLVYEWKISFPDSPMLHSFKHSQKVYIEGITKQLRVRIITGKCIEEQLYIKNKFYKQIEEMNNQLSKFIVNTFEKQADILIEAQTQESKSLESCNIIIDQVNFEDVRDSKFQIRDSIRNSRIQRQKSTIQFGSSNGFKTG